MPHAEVKVDKLARKNQPSIGLNLKVTLLGKRLGNLDVDNVGVCGVGGGCGGGGGGDCNDDDNGHDARGDDDENNDDVEYALISNVTNIFENFFYTVQVRTQENNHKAEI